MTSRIKRTLPDVLLVALLMVAMIQAVRLAISPAGSGQAFVPLLRAGTPIESVQGPGSADRALTTEVAVLGDWLSVEDLCRGVLALEQGELTGVAPLSPAERTRVAELVAAADAHRKALLEVEAQLAASEVALGDEARRIAATLTPEQRTWVQTQRDNVSVGQVEAAYWAELGTVLAAPPVVGSPK